MEQIVLLDPDGPPIIFWSRSADQTWARTILIGLDAILPFPAIGFALH